MSKRIEHLKAMIAQDPGNPFPQYALGIEYINEGETDAACECLQKARNTFPGYIPTYYHLAQTYEALEDREKALETYQEGITRAEQAGEHHALKELTAAYTMLSNTD